MGRAARTWSGPGPATAVLPASHHRPLSGWTAGGRPFRTVPPMLISYVLRLRPDALAEGRFVGEIEAVTTRRRSSIRSVDQVAAFILGGTPAREVATEHPRQHAPGACGGQVQCRTDGLRLELGVGT